MEQPNGNGRATIREVYAIAQRLEDKIDALDMKVNRFIGYAMGAGAAGGFFINSLVDFLKQ